MKTRHNQKALLMLLLMGFSLQGANAQGDPLLEDTQSILNSEQINIDGNFNAPKQPTAADRIEAMRKKLEERNEQMVQKKIEDMRMKEEMRLATKLNKAFSGNMDSVNMTQAAPVKKVVVAPVPVVKKKKVKKNKVIPSFGLMAISGENGLDLESSTNFNLAMENQVHERISIGLSVGYTKLAITDTANQYAGTNYTNYNTFNNVSPYYNTGYNNTYGQGREMGYSRLSLEVNSKVFISVENTIRPYVGLGLGYNRHDLGYEDNSEYNLGNVQLGNEEFSSSYVAGSVLVGSEVHFTETLGANIEFKYQKGLGDSFNTTSASTNSNPDQVRLENVGSAIEKANNMSLNAGLLIKF
ncbi:hypothetical protein A9Q84_15840 [Halobacteriovorax marinus]|uniref:Outer membrane protein beta-barrel domain-containing protein n=1 Tax=Halobacteriovorax marinus TaxID=97084 RepID=A0A1Y5F9G3_9BACT|nr:hypothetical protein A9Q84_15840 [Halobacteriovorax marinus]